MSGEKRSPIQIVRDDLNATRRMVTNTQSQNAKLQRSLRQAQDQRRKDNSRFQAELDHRTTQFNNSVNNLQSNMRQMEKRHVASIDRQNKQFKAKIKAQEKQFDRKLDNLQSNLEKNIQELGDWTSTQLQEQQQEYRSLDAERQREIAGVRKDVQQLFEKEKANKDFARQFIQDLAQQISLAEETLPFDRFDHDGELDVLKTRFAAARRLYEQGQESAATAQLQERYFNLVDLRNKIIAREQEYAYWHQITLEAARVLFEHTQSNERIELEQGFPTQQVDFWTNGRYAALTTRVQQLKDRLEEERDTLSLEDVQQIHQQIQEESAKQSDLIKEAIERVISSQLRTQMGDIVVETLQEQGFDMTESGYEQKDERKIYLIKMEDRTGTEIAIAVIPDDQTHKNTLSINTRDPRFLNEESTQERFEQIKNLLGEAGLHLGESECNDSHIEEFYDVENLIKEGSQGVPKKVLNKIGLLNSQTK